jgi:hypothetical protein
MRMNERGNMAGTMSEILNKAENIPGLSKDDRDLAFRTYRLLYNIKGYKLAPIALGILFAITGGFFSAIILSAMFGPSDPNLIYWIAGTFIVCYAASAAFFKLKFYDKWLEAEISGFKYAMDRDPKIIHVLGLIKTNDPKVARNIDKYLLVNPI